jgi:hypothetical protein
LIEGLQQGLHINRTKQQEPRRGQPRRGHRRLGEESYEQNGSLSKYSIDITVFANIWGLDLDS